MSGGDVYTATRKCWSKRDENATPYGIGEKYVLNDGNTHFLPLTKTAAGTSTTYTYPWGKGASATEVTTFGNGTPPAITSVTTVRGSVKLTIRTTITPLAEAPQLPIAAPPALPKPTPLCR
jgi:hypothetical protein